MRYLLILICFFTSWVDAKGIGNFSATPQELARLPGYCTPKAHPKGNDLKRADVKYWSNRLGTDVYLHIHHYCHALVQIQHYLEGMRKQSGLIGAAQRNLDYSIDNTPPQHPILLDLLLTKSYLFELSFDFETAQELALQVQQADPKRVQTYVQLSRIYWLDQQPDKTMAVLAQGVTETDSQILKQRQDNFKAKLAAHSQATAPDTQEP